MPRENLLAVTFCITTRQIIYCHHTMEHNILFRSPRQNVIMRKNWTVTLLLQKQSSLSGWLSELGAKLGTSSVRFLYICLSLENIFVLRVSLSMGGCSCMRSNLLQSSLGDLITQQTSYSCSCPTPEL